MTKLWKLFLIPENGCDKALETFADNRKWII